MRRFWVQISGVLLLATGLSSCGPMNEYEREALKGAPEAQVALSEMNDVMSEVIPRCAASERGLHCFQPHYNRELRKAVSALHNQFVRYFQVGASVSIFVLSVGDFKNLQGNDSLLGMCNRLHNMVFISSNIPRELLKVTLWHELGHCALGLNHDEAYISLTDENERDWYSPKSIMYPYGFEIDPVSPFTDAYYLKEMMEKVH